MAEAYIFLEVFETIRLPLGTSTADAAHPLSDAETGEPPMSALAFEWMPAETETITSIPVKAPENPSREEEFRLALDGYIANYIAQQKRRTEAVGNVRHWRWLLTASREIWLFSRAMNRDWRGDLVNMGR